jgi:predicted N-formylglutamate amidohydrolase
VESVVSKYDSEISLIRQDEVPPVHVFNACGRAPVLLVADHASRHIPANLNQLGLADWVLDKHVAWDIGSDLVTRYLALHLDAPAVLAGFSRLIIDPNRPPGSDHSCVKVSDGIAIPGNLDIDELEFKRRKAAFFDHYHRAIEQQLERFFQQGVAPAFIAMHSCSPVYDRMIRPWHVGVMWDADDRLAGPVLANLQRRQGVCVGDNEPYSGRHPDDYTIDHHAERNGLAAVGIEIRQDLIANSDGARHWAQLLAEIFDHALTDERVYAKMQVNTVGQ